MKNATMLYRCPGPEEFEGVRCETTVVEAEDVEAAKAEGWRENWVQAAAARDELQAKIAAAEGQQAALAAQMQQAGGDAADDLVGDGPADKPLDAPRARKPRS